MNYTDLLRYVSATLAGYEYEIDKAIEDIDHYRCSISSASETITSLIDDAGRDYCDDNDIDYYNFDVESAFGRDLETIFFDALTEMDYYDSPDAEYDE
jgi:hypothetical protein